MHDNGDAGFGPEPRFSLEEAKDVIQRAFAIVEREGYRVAEEGGELVVYRRDGDSASIRML